MEVKRIRKLNKTKLQNRKHKNVKTSEALKDVRQIAWSDEVMQGNKKVMVSKGGFDN